jgi:hypothetical protein
VSNGPTPETAAGWAKLEAMIEASFRDPHLAALGHRIEAVRATTLRLVSWVSAEELARRPANGGWSAAEVFEHLCVANVSYDLPVERAIELSRARPGTPRPYRSTLGGSFLIRSLRPGTRNVPTLKPYRPGTPRKRVVEAFLASLDAVEARMHEADGLDLRIMITSPVMPILRLNLGEAFEVAVVHAERHLGQVERTLKAVAV